MVKTLPVSFLSENTQIVGTIYLPNTYTQESKLPGIILCQGFAGTKEMLLPPYAEQFAEHGYIVLTFDYRGFGGSAGDPGRLVPSMQIADIKSATDFLVSFAGIDATRIGLWGTSYGGANAIVAASQDKRIKCLSVQLTFGNGERCIATNSTPEDMLKLKEMLAKLHEKKISTGKEMMVSVSKILSDEQSKSFLQEYADKFPELNIKIPFLTIRETINYKPEEVLPQLHLPILIIGAEQDGVNPVSETYSLYNAAMQPKELLIISGAKHFELYHGQHLQQAINKQLEWFGKYL